MLIYPNHADFNNQLHFKYEEELRIDIVPFDIQNEMASLKFYEELLAGFNQENIHNEIDTGKVTGNEIW